MPVKPGKGRVVVAFLALVLLAGGLIASVVSTRSKVDYRRFEIPQERVREMGYFSNLTDRASVSGLVLTPKTPAFSPGGLRPVVLYFHGMMARKEYHLHHATYLARAGFVVVMVDHAGQGDSMGTYRLGLECEALGLTVLDWLFEEGNSSMNLRINGSQVGATGHSYGGVTAALLGINRPDQVQAVVSVWAWADLVETVGLVLGVAPPELFNDPTWDLLSLTSFPASFATNGTGHPTSSDPDALTNNLEQRDLTPKLSAGPTPKPPNWLLITAEDDSLTTPRQQMDLVANASFFPGDPGGWSAADLRASIEEGLQPDDYWDNLDASLPSSLRGSFEEKTARGLYLPKNNPPVPHAVEGIRQDGIALGLSWFGRAFHWDVGATLREMERTGWDVGPYVLPGEAASRYLGFAVASFGLFLLAFPVASFVLKYKRTPEEYLELQGTPLIPEQETAGLAVKIVAVGGATFAFTVASPVTALALGFSGPTVGVPFLLYDAFVAVFLARSMFVAPFMALFYLAMRKHSQLQWAEVGVEKNLVAPGILFGGGFALGLILLYDAVAAAAVFPPIWPRESPSFGLVGTYLLFGYFALFGFIDEILLRGIVQGCYERAAYRAPKLNRTSYKKWAAYAASAATSFGVNFGGSALGVVVLLERAPTQLLLGLVYVPFFLYALLTSLVNTFLYQRARNVVPGVAFTMTFFSFLFSSNVLGGLGF
ncbi:MAG: hypothetical protein Kow0069_03240 [Promethearchaeota archaeon]